MRILGIIVVVVVLLLLVCWGMRGTIVSGILTSKFGVKTTVGSFTFGTGHLTIRNVQMNNLPGSSLPVAFSADEITITTTLGQLFGETVTIDKILISDVYMSVETYNTSGKDNNWSRIFAAMDKGEKEEKQSNQEPTQFLLKDLEIRNLRVEAKLAALNGKIIKPDPIPEMAFQDLGTGRPLPYAEIVALITQAALKQLLTIPDLSQGLQGVFDSSGDFLKGAGQGVQQTIQSIFGK